MGGVLPIPAQAVCNSILQLSFEENIPVSPMKLQKLLYFVYRDYLKETDELLFSERFEAWPSGPVLPSVYSEFKSFCDQPITKFAKNADGSVSVISKAAIGAQCVVNTIKSVWDKYKHLNGIQLSGLTYQKGTAWNQANSKHELLLDIDSIKEETLA